MIAEYKFKKFEFHAFQNFIWDLINRFQIGQIKFSPHQRIDLFDNHQLTHIGPVYNLDNPGDFLYAWSRNKETVRAVTYDQFHKNGTPKIKVVFDLDAKTMTVKSTEGIDMEEIRESFEKFFEFDSEDKGMEISDILPKEMADVFLKNPPIQAEDIVKKYYFGLIIETSGVINRVDRAPNYVTVIFDDRDGVHMACNFFRPVSAEVARLNKGMAISLVGEVFNVAEGMVVLDHCKLLKQNKEYAKNSLINSPVNVIGSNNVVGINSSNVRQEIKNERISEVTKDSFWNEFIIKIVFGGILATVVGGLILYWLTK